MSDRIGPTPDQGYGLYTAAQPGPPEDSTPVLSGSGEPADVGYRHSAIAAQHSHPHAAFGGPTRPHGDGMHSHAHSHIDDDNHDHDHSGLDWLDELPEPSAVQGAEIGPSQGGQGRGQNPLYSGMGYDDGGRFGPRERSKFLNGPEFAMAPDYDDEPAHLDLNQRITWAEEQVARHEDNWHECRSQMMDARYSYRSLPTPTNQRELSELEVAEARLADQHERAKELLSRLLSEWEATAEQVSLQRPAGRTGGIQEVLHDPEAWRERNAGLSQIDRAR